MSISKRLARIGYAGPYPLAGWGPAPAPAASSATGEAGSYRWGPDWIPTNRGAAIRRTSLTACSCGEPIRLLWETDWTNPLSGETSVRTHCGCPHCCRPRNPIGVRVVGTLDSRTGVVTRYPRPGRWPDRVAIR